MEKRFVSSIIVSAVFVFLVFSACDKVDAPYVIHNQPIDTAKCPAPAFPAVNSHFKRVLLEDYTGHNCPNCPGGALIAHGLQNQYKDTLVLIAVHAGFFAKVSASDPLWKYDFRTDPGTDWDNFFKIAAVGNPNGMVNRKGYPKNQQVLSPSSWANAVKTSAAEAPLLDLQIIINNDADQDYDELCIHTKTSFLQPISGRNLNLSVIITEDSIIQPQNNSDPLVGATPQILNYVHMHVLRGAVNGSWGTPVLLKENTSTTPVVKSFSVNLTTFNLNPVIPKNCHVVAFVYDTDTKEILQAAEEEIK